jgi:hypothetical protein
VRARRVCLRAGPAAAPGNYYSLKSQHEKAVLYFQRALRLNRQAQPAPHQRATPGRALGTRQPSLTLRVPALSVRSIFRRGR